MADNDEHGAAEPLGAPGAMTDLRSAVAALEHGTGLCPSGDGYRAMLFHFCSLRRLHEVGLLKTLERESSVSGRVSAPKWDPLQIRTEALYPHHCSAMKWGLDRRRPEPLSGAPFWHVFSKLGPFGTGVPLGCRLTSRSVLGGQPF